MRLISLALLALELVACSPRHTGASDLPAAEDHSPLVQAAAAAVQARFPGLRWMNVREKAGLRENAVCAEVGGQQVIYREKRRLLMAQATSTKEPGER